MAGDGPGRGRRILEKLGILSGGTKAGRSHNFQAWRTLTQFLWLFVITSTIFGVPYFARTSWLHNVYWPSLSSRFITSNPTSCAYYAVTSGLQNGVFPYITIIVPLVIFILLIVLLGRAWCAWTCPVGFLQEILGGLRRLVGFPYKELSPKVVLALDRFKYAFLFFVILIALASSIPALGLGHLATDFADPSCQLCPARPICTIALKITGAEPLEASLPYTSIVILAIFIVGTLSIRRFWCRICPLGAMMAPINRRAMLTLRKDGNKCTRCRACLRVCPMDIQEVYAEMERTNITAPECIHCYRCVEECPEDDCLTVEYMGRTIARSGLKKPKDKKGKGKDVKGGGGAPSSAGPPAPVGAPVPVRKPGPAPPATPPADPPAAPPATPPAGPPAAPPAAPSAALSVARAADPGLTEG